MVGNTTNSLHLMQDGTVGIGTITTEGKVQVTGGETVLKGTNQENGLTLVGASNSSPSGQSIRFFGANRSDDGEEACRINGVMTNNNGGAGNIQDGRLEFYTSGDKQFQIYGSGSSSFAESVRVGTLDAPLDELHVTGISRFDRDEVINGNYGRAYLNGSSTVDYGLRLTHTQGDTGKADAMMNIGGSTTQLKIILRSTRKVTEPKTLFNCCL